MEFSYSFPELNYEHKVDDPAYWTESYISHYHKIYEIVYFIEGDGEFLIENKRYPLSSGDLMLILPGSHHNIHLLSSKRYERYVLNFTEYLVPSDLLATLQQMEGCYKVGGGVIPELFARFDEHIVRVNDDEKKIQMLFRCVLTEIIVYLCSEGNREGVSSKLLKEDMSRVIDYINKNLEKPICLEDICSEFHYSKSYICREFSKSMGVPVMSYVRTKKMTYAAALLRAGMRPTDVALQCGYSDYSTFYRLYVKTMGVPPSAHGKNHGDND